MEITIPIGDHIETAFVRAIEAARRSTSVDPGRRASGQQVTFKFNGRAVTVTASDTVERCLAAWNAENERLAAIYRASPEYAAEQARYASAEADRLARVGTLRAFPLHAALTLATGRVWGSFSDARDLAEWMMNEDPASIGMAIMADALRREVVTRYPHLGLVDPSEYPDSPDRIRLLTHAGLPYNDPDVCLRSQVALYGETVALPCGCITADEQRSKSASALAA